MKLATLARALFGVPMVIFGVMHFMYGEMMAGLVPAAIPGGVLWVYIIGLVLIASGVSIVAARYMREMGLVLAATLGLFVVFVHIPGLGVAATQQVSMSNMLKDIALAGGALYLSSRARE
jgi:uncharacterized membrane protein